MSRILIVFALLCAGLSILTLGSYASSNDEHHPCAQRANNMDSGDSRALVSRR
jgi:hypothetical protein